MTLSTSYSTTDPMHKRCPMCNSAGFIQTSELLNLQDILTRWEKEAGVKFRPAVWEAYAKPDFSDITFYRCEHCDFGLYHPPIIGNNDFYEDITATNYYVADKWEHRQAIRDLRSHECIQVLDYGCGSGNFLRLLKQKYPETIPVGYEYATKVAEEANSEAIPIYTGDFSSLSLKEGGKNVFDAVTCFQVLEHVADPVDLLKNLGERIKPGGFLILGLPDDAGPLNHFVSALTNIPPHHVSKWSDKTFRMGFPKLGFSVVRIAKEPLPNYLWPFYLPVMWDECIWPAKIMSIFNKIGNYDKKKQIDLFINTMNRLNLKWLPGVPGHTFYVLLQKG